MKCQSCGKQYDYNKEESCPWCGAYNIPRGGGTHTCTAAEMDGARTHQEIESRRVDRGAPAFPSSSGSSQRTSGTGTRPYQQYRGSAQSQTEGQTPNRTPGYTPSYVPGEPATGEERRRTKSVARRLIGIFVILFVVTNVIGAVINLIASPDWETSSTPAAPDYPASSGYWWEDGGEEDPVFFDHEVEEPFAACGYTVTVHSMTQLPLDGYYPELSEDAVFLAVDVTATLMDIDAWSEYESPFLYIYYNDWWDYALPLDIEDEDYGAELYAAIGKEPIDFDSAEMGETITGTFIFLITDPVEMLTFGVDEYRLRDSAYIAGHEVAFPVESVISTTL